MVNKPYQNKTVNYCFIVILYMVLDRTFSIDSKSFSSLIHRKAHRTIDLRGFSKTFNSKSKEYDPNITKTTENSIVYGKITY